MEITTNVDGATASIAITGKLSVATSPDLESAIFNLGDSVSNFDIDLSGLEYISSAGLRVLVSTEKLAAQRGGKMTLMHPNDEVTEIFDMTGLADVFTIVA